MPRIDPQAESLFAAAAELPGEARKAFLDRACAGQEELRGQLEGLLQAHDRVNHVIDRPAVGHDRLDATCLTDAPAAGAIIAGRYKLLEQIGDGGMGAVWMAEQREPVKRLVAVKLIKPGMDSQAVLARFEAERQALALMDHPNIAKVHDAGTDESGRPYFVMELVKGLPLTEYCDARKLTVRERLDLFVQICSAVQHAHQKAIIHRDLKPTNVLVTEHDGHPVPKVIDFGLAKALNASQMLTDRTLHTAYGTVVGTPLYMAPEQVGINALDVDTRTDIYALGVILYELLTGTTPREKARFKEAAWDEVKRLIREEEPPRPSTRLSSDKTLPSLAASRQVDPGQLTRQIQGELDWIVMKTLDKDRGRRYETATGLAKDVQRFLNGEAVEACPPTMGYRLRKAYRRNRTAILTGVSFAIVLLIATGVSAWQAVRATRAEQVAQADRQRAIEAEEIAHADRRRALEAERKAKEEKEGTAGAVQFMRQALFGQADPDQEPDRTLTLRDALDRAAVALDRQPPGNPLVEASIRVIFGDTYGALGEVTEAEKHFQRAWDIRREKLGDDDPDTIMAKARTVCLFDLDRLPEAIRVLEEAVLQLRQTQGEDHPDTLEITYRLGHKYSRLHYLESNLKGEHSPGEQFVMLERARTTFKELNERCKRTVGKENPLALRTIIALSQNYIARLGNHDPENARRAEELAREARELSTRLYSTEHPLTLEATRALAHASSVQLKHDDAIQLLEPAVEASTRVFGESHPDTMILRRNLCYAYLGADKIDKAERVMGEVLAWTKTRPDGIRPIFGYDHSLMGIIYLKLGRWDQAKPLIEEARRILTALGLTTWPRHHIDHLLGACLLHEKKYAEAEPLLVNGYKELKAREHLISPDGRWRLDDALERIIQFYDATNRPKEAEKFRKELEVRKAAQKQLASGIP